MNDFKQQLNQEMERRGLVEEETPQEPQAPKKIGARYFSILAFLKGLFLGLVVLGLLVGWAWYKQGETAQSMLSSLPSKTAIVQKDTSELFRLSDAKPTLSMAPVEEKEVEPTIAVPPQEAVPLQQTQQVEKMENNPSSGVNAAMMEGLYEPVANGKALPILDKKNKMSVFKAFRSPFTPEANKPTLSIVITDMGLSQKLTAEAIESLPAGVTFSFSPYAQKLNSLIEQARQDGHEAWLTLPMQTKDYPLHDPGPLALLTGVSVEQNTSRLHATLSAATGYVGLISQKDHSFRQEDTSVNPVFTEIFERGLAIVDSTPILYSFIEGLAEKKEYPHGKNNFWLDDSLSPVALNQSIRRMIEFGKQRGDVIVMVRPTSASLKALQKFLDSAAAKEFQIAPLSAKVKFGN